MHFLAGYVGPGHLLDAVIRRATRGPISHVEIVRDGEWASASWRDGGVRVKRIFPKPQHWRFLRLDDAAGHAAFDFIRRHAGAGYDIPGAITGPTLGWRMQIDGRWFCSEIVGRALGMPRPWTLSPTDVFERAKALQRGERLAEPGGA